MFRLIKISALALLLAMVAAIQASAATIQDPIVRTRTGPGASIHITSLPFIFDWGTFPTPPPDTPDDPFTDCSAGTDIDTDLPMVSCHFLNLTGEAIGFLDFQFNYDDITGSIPDLSEFQTQDPNEFWNFRTIDQFSAQFIGGGIPALNCPFEGECVPFDFFVDLIGFPDGTHVTMTADASAVPEPMTLTLLATGLALGAGARRRTKKEGRRTKD